MPDLACFLLCTYAAPSPRSTQDAAGVTSHASGGVDSLDSPSPFPPLDPDRVLKGTHSNLSLPPSAPATEGGGEKGILFTWGGSFSLSDGGGGGGAKPDTHKGCLGTGDKDGRLVPTRVLGELENQAVIQVRVTQSP